MTRLTHRPIRVVLIILALLGITTAVWAGPEEEVRETVQGYIDAIAAGDAEAAAAFWAEDAQLISPVYNARIEGRAAIKKVLVRWFETTSSRQYSDAKIDVQVYQDNIAVLYATYTRTTVGNDGQTHVTRRRSTSTRVKRDGRWLLVSAHASYLPRKH